MKLLLEAQVTHLLDCMNVSFISDIFGTLSSIYDELFSGISKRSKAVRYFYKKGPS